MKKKCLAMLLTLCMVLTLLPTAALAAEEETDTDTVSVTVTKEGGEAVTYTSWSAVQNAIKPENDETVTATITLGSDVNAGNSTALTVSDNMYITLELNNHKIVSSNTYTIAVGNVRENYGPNDGKHDHTDSGTLYIHGPGTVDNVSTNCTTIRNFGTLTIGEEVTSTTDTTTKANNDGLIIMGEGTDDDIQVGEQARSAIKNEEGSKLTIYGGKINGDFRSIQNIGTIDIYDGTFTNTVEAWKYQAYASVINIHAGTFNAPIQIRSDNSWTGGGNVTIKGGTFNAAEGKAIIAIDNSVPETYAGLSIESGIFTGTLLRGRNASSNGADMEVPAAITSLNDSVKGGTFSVDPTDYLADNYGVEQVDNKYEVGESKLSISLTPTTASVEAGKTTTLTLVINAQFTPAPTTFTVKSSDDSVATAEISGEKITVTGRKAGTATITASWGEGEEVTATVNVTAPVYIPPSTPSTPSTPSSSTVVNPDGSTTTTTTNPATGAVTEVTKNEDGSTNTVVTEKDGTVTTTDDDGQGNVTTVAEAPDGTVTTTEQSADGSVAETVENPDGSKEITTELADGTTAETVIDAAGVQTSEVTVPAAVAAAAAETGETIPLPITEVAVTTDAEIAPTVTVDLPAETAATVEIPVDSVTKGTVAIIVYEDGTEEIVMNCVPTENGLSVPLEGGATVKIVDNSMDFPDVEEGHWAEDAVDFASARGIMIGEGDGFNGEGLTTRGQLMTILARLDGHDTSPAEGEVWYGPGMDWAVENQISDGTDPEGNITREQLAVMLWRYAGEPASTQSVDHFTDAGDISSWADEAMRWCVEVGILTGWDNAVEPGDSATRNEAVAMIMRYCEYIATQA